MGGRGNKNAESGLSRLDLLAAGLLLIVLLGVLAWAWTH